MKQSRKVMRYGKRSNPTNVVCIPVAICRELEIVPGTILFFKIEDSKIILSKEPFEEKQTDDTTIQDWGDKFWGRSL